MSVPISQFIPSPPPSPATFPPWCPYICSLEILRLVRHRKYTKKIHCTQPGSGLQVCPTTSPRESANVTAPTKGGSRSNKGSLQKLGLILLPRGGQGADGRNQVAVIWLPPNYSTYRKRLYVVFICIVNLPLNCPKLYNTDNVFTHLYTQACTYTPCKPRSWLSGRSRGFQS